LLEGDDKEAGEGEGHGDRESGSRAEFSERSPD
jgi:hypothetical protein